MAKNPLELRRERYFKLSSQIAQIDNTQLRSLLGDSPSGGGWGRHHTVRVGQSRVFVKRVPVTNIEHDNMFSTRNLYDLPTYYNYGVGSAGLGVFRELVALIKTTNWVLEGAIATFPLMYHYRIVPFTGTRVDVNMQRHREYVEHWNSNENVGRYLLDRANADHELVLFLEYIPYALHPWLLKHPHTFQKLLNDLCAAITFLHKNGIIHFDAHYYNVLTDGEQAYLTDFGLVLDRSFDLTREERLFFNRNSCYDYGEVLCCLDSLLFGSYEALPKREQCRIMQAYGIKEGVSHHELVSILLDNVVELSRGSLKHLDHDYVASILRCRSIIALMDEFYSQMRSNKKKDTKLRHSKLRRLLKEAEILPETERLTP
jgi:serine/threonine protein kinase